MSNKSYSILCFFLMLALLAGCGKRINTARDLANALKRNGIGYRTTESLDLNKLKHARIDEAMALKGDQLWVEIYQITHEKTYKVFAGSTLILAVAERKAEQRLPGRPDICTKKPFVIVVREEPHKGDVKKALESIFPGDSE